MRYMERCARCGAGKKSLRQFEFKVICQICGAIFEEAQIAKNEI